MKNLSVSKIDKFLQCPLAFKYRYIDKIPETTSMVVHGGRVVHEVIEHALKQFAQTGKYPDWQTMDDLYEPVWERQTKEEEEKESFVSWQFDPDDPPEKVRAECRPLVRLAREEALPKIRPFMAENGPVIEYRVDLEFKSDVGPFKTLGFIDLLDDTGLLSDWKTTKKVSARAKKGWMQAASYSFWVYPTIGEEIVRAQKIFLVRGDDPHIEYAPTEVGPMHRKWFAKIAAEVWKSIHHGVYPARAEGWWCSPKFCSFYGPCQEGVGKPEEEPVKEMCVACKGSGKIVIEPEEKNGGN
jgi:CRISPR/Cas system-associated exonuclease Cas4 (RecB family)